MRSNAKTNPNMSYASSLSSNFAVEVPHAIGTDRNYLLPGQKATKVSPPRAPGMRIATLNKWERHASD